MKRPVRSGRLPPAGTVRFRADAWPLPALAAWAVCWIVFACLRSAGASAGFAVGVSALAGAALATGASTPWRRVFVASGFPLSLLASGAAGDLAAWAWLLPLAALALLYPVTSWRDAPMFPTRRGALAGLGKRVALPEGAAILDAGCGLGDALRELHREYPHARCVGVERSRPLAFAAALRCRFASVDPGDMWAADWSRYDLVYVFQRPESMARAAEKAARELRAGAWLASLEFEVTTLRPTEVIDCGTGGRKLWLYQAPRRPR